MDFSHPPEQAMFGFLYIRSNLRYNLDLSQMAAFFFDELRESPSMKFFTFEAFGPDYCAHTDYYINASLELASHGILINTYISNN